MLIRQMTRDDVNAVAEIEKVCFSQPWSEKSLQDSIARDDTIFLVCEVEQKIIGYIGMYLSFEEANITNVAVSPERRQQGIGQFLVAHAKVAAKEKQTEAIFLEVRKSNVPAISLYKKMGFEELGLRKRFYEHPVEDALIMSCTL